MMMFPEADKSCDDVSKVYNGGNKVLYFDDTTPAVSVDMLFKMCIRDRPNLDPFVG